MTNPFNSRYKTICETAEGGEIDIDGDRIIFWGVGVENHHEADLLTVYRELKSHFEGTEYE